MKKIGLFTIALGALALSGCNNTNGADFTKTNQVTLSNLSVEIPAVFTKDNNTYDSGTLFYNYDDNDKNACMLSLYVNDYPSSDMKKTVQEGLLNETNFEYNEKNINGQKWSIGYIEKNVKCKESYYAINYNGKKYEIGYSDMGSGDECAEALKIIEKSLKLK